MAAVWSRAPACCLTGLRGRAGGVPALSIRWVLKVSDSNNHFLAADSLYIAAVCS